jgi:tetratricopeptide (TPR) repeat protein
MSAYLESLDITKRSSILSEKLGSLYAAQGKPSSAADEFERALKLDTSPLQRVRLRLLLADGLVALNRDEPAMDHLDKLLQENPDYPDRLGIYRRLLALAQKLGKKEAATNYEGRVRELTPPPPPRQP